MMAMRLRPTRIARRSARPSDDPAQDRIDALIALTYELLDAHIDTAQLAGSQASDAEWGIHLAYLKDLQRVGREALAQAEAARPYR